MRPSAVPVPVQARARLAIKQRKQALKKNAADIAPQHDESFRAWCTRLADAGLAVDGHPFRLDNRPALHAIYDLIPTQPEDANGRVVVLMKGAQMGLTIWEVLADLYMAMKWEPVTIGMYVPDAKLAPYKSTHRFLRLVKSVPDIWARMTIQVESSGKQRSVGAGNVLTRTLGESIFLFLWTTGATMTESFPADVVSFDEVQNMSPGDISKVQERLSASRVNFTMLLSTPKWPDADIHFWYRRGTMHTFHTYCEGCGAESVLTDYLVHDVSAVIGLDPKTGKNRYKCPACTAWIADPQVGKWIAQHPEREIESYHLSQVLSPTVSAGQLLKALQEAATGEQRANVTNRKLGLPFSDPSQIPVSRTILAACVEAGKVAGVTWEQSARDTYMGIDQMGGFNAILIKRRLSDGRQSLVHAEAVFDQNAFAGRTTELMEQYGVAVCVVEGLPNWNDAKRFANNPKHAGRVFVASYGDQPDTAVWGDQVARTDRKTEQEEQDRWVVRLNQYKAMQSSLARITATHCLFPDPSGIECDYRDGPLKRVLLLNDIVFEHLTRVALISERDPETGRWKTHVKKVGIDPHFAYANMLCDVAWSRAHGATSFILTDKPAPEPGSDPIKAVHATVEQARAAVGTCGACGHFAEGMCTQRGFATRATTPGCELLIPAR